jgi:branched-chain amino acid transport system ATP-binding protein
MPLALEVSDLRVGYGAFTVIPDFAIGLAEGACVALIGPNGAGKSTLLKGLAGALRDVSGSVKIYGVNLAGRQPHEMLKAGLSLVPEGRHIFSSLTVADNLMLGALRLHDRGTNQAAQRAFVFSLFPRLRERLGQRAGTLSGGEQQMLAIGRSLMAKPRILLLDEPFTGLAPLVVGEIISAISKLSRSGITTLIVEQRTTQILGLCQHIYAMAKGRIVFDVPAERFDRLEDLLPAYFGARRQAPTT